MSRQNPYESLQVKNCLAFSESKGLGPSLGIARGLLLFVDSRLFCKFQLTDDWLCYGGEMVSLSLSLSLCNTVWVIHSVQCVWGCRTWLQACPGALRSPDAQQGPPVSCLPVSLNRVLQASSGIALLNESISLYTSCPSFTLLWQQHHEIPIHYIHV